MDLLEIVERNKQIALMLGWKEATLEYKLKWCSVPTEERLNKLEQSYVPILMNEKGEALFEDTLDWHSDWNALMGALTYITKLGWNWELIDFKGSVDEDNCFSCSIFNLEPYKPLNKIEHSSSEPIKAVFLVVSDFAKSYNEKI